MPQDQGPEPHRANLPAGQLAHRSMPESAAEPEDFTRQLQQRFTSMISHEFRTPLAIIDAAAQNIRLRDQRNTRSVEAIRTAVRRLLRMMDACLNEGRMEVDTDQLRTQTFDLRVVLDAAVRAARIAAPARRIDLRGSTHSLTVDADPRRLEIAIGNLLENAVQYSPVGSTVTVAATAVLDGIEVVVEDEGSGIPQADRERVFEKYHRSDNIAGIPGAGLGLYVARELLRLHGGSLQYAQAEGGGSRFTLWIPGAVRPSPEEGI